MPSADATTIRPVGSCRSWGPSSCCGFTAPPRAAGRTNSPQSDRNTGTTPRFLAFPPQPCDNQAWNRLRGPSENSKDCEPLARYPRMATAPAVTSDDDQPLSKQIFEFVPAWLVSLVVHLSLVLLLALVQVMGNGGLGGSGVVLNVETSGGDAKGPDED